MNAFRDVSIIPLQIFFLIFLFLESAGLQSMTQKKINSKCKLLSLSLSLSQTNGTNIDICLVWQEIFTGDWNIAWKDESNHY